MVRYLLIVNIPGLCQAFVASKSQDILQIRRGRRVLGKSVQIPADLLCPYHDQLYL